jgi:hypothetical protein
MKNKIELIEPLSQNRWLIETYPTKISSHLFRKYRLFNEGDKIILNTEFLETVINVYNPFDLLEITDITLKYLDPIGDVVGGFKMTVQGLNFDKKHSYSNDGLLMTKMRFVIDHIELLNKPTQDLNSIYGQPKE